MPELYRGWHIIRMGNRYWLAQKQSTNGLLSMSATTQYGLKAKINKFARSEALWRVR